MQDIIAKHFPVQAGELEFAQFREALIQTITYLLQHDIERLSQAMYRIDVAEEAFREALYSDDAVRLADLAIERVKQKILFRQQYAAMNPL